MGYLALYRRYRPDTFENLIGQDHIVRILTNQIIKDRLGHAYLFTGTRGTGKTSTAKIFAKAINCQNPKNGSPCGECPACKALKDPANIDVIEIDAASNNGVDQIRELREKVQFPPVSVKYKVYIIDEVHMLTGPAFNALLKTLEEPPKHAIFILATTEVHKIPATILSRCMRFDFKLVPTEVIANHIAKIYDMQKKEYEMEGVFAIAKAGEGSIRDALSIADTALSYSNGKLTYDDVMEILGSTNYQTILEFVEAIIDNNSGKVLQIIDTLSSFGKSMGVVTKDVIELVRDILIIKTCENANKILLLPQDKYNKIEEISKKTTEQRLLRILQIFVEMENTLKYSTRPRVLFETASIKATSPETDYSIDAITLRVAQLEKQIANGVVVEKANDIKEIKKQEENVKEPLTNDNIKGKLLHALRTSGKEMLWNMLGQMEVKIDRNKVIITVKDENDKDLMDRENNINAIKECLVGYPVEVVIEVDKNAYKKEEVEDATEKIKKIFGDDIVIIK